MTALSNIHLPAADLQITLISTSKDFLALKDEWRTLNKSSPKGCIFTSWEWLFTWWEIYQNDGKRQLFILICTNKFNSLVGIAPFQIINNPKKYFPCSKQLIMLGTGETDNAPVFGEYMDLIIYPGYEEKVLASFSDFIYARKNQWDGAKFHELLADSHVSQLFRAYEKTIIKEVKPLGFRTLVELPENYSTYLKSLKGKVRSNIKRMTKRLENEQDATVEVVENKKDVEKAISILANLNQARRSELNKNSVFDSSNFVTFHKKLAKRLIKHHEISINIMYFGETPVAANYQFIDKNTVHGYQTGLDMTKGGRYSLLTLLISHEIKNSINNKKIDYFNFMYSEDESSYKKKYTGITETMFVVSFDQKSPKTTIFKLIHGPIKQFIKHNFKK